MYIRDERIGNSESEKLYTWASASLYNIQTHSINTINTRMYLFSSQSQHRAPYRMNILSGIESRSFLFYVSTAGAKNAAKLISLALPWIFANEKSKATEKSILRIFIKQSLISGSKEKAEHSVWIVRENHR